MSRQQTAEGVVFVVKDPVVGRFLRFREQEYFIARQLDGTTPLEEVKRRAEEQFGAALRDETLERFANKLRNLGLLEAAEDSVQTAAPVRPQRRLSGNPLYLRFRIFDPDALFTRLIPSVRLFFTPPFAWFSLAVIALAALVTISRWEELHASWIRLYRPETLLFAWLTFLGIVIGHEFSHGLMCKRFGGRVHEVGLLLIYLQPAMYCNVSDAWLFPEKRKRLLVTLAGAWFEIFCWAIATLLWRLTEPGTLINYLALVIATTLGIKSLFNLNPLIKLDGYYLLSDLVEIPNLRANALAYMGRRLTRFGRRKADELPTARVRRIYWLYGVLALSYSTWLIALILAGLGSFLIRRYQGWGFAAFAALVVIFFRTPLRKGARVLTSFFAVRQGILLVMKRLARLAVLLALSGVLLYCVRVELNISGEFRILPLHNAEVRAEVEGLIEAIDKDEGDVVKPGDVIARLSDRDYRADLEKITAEISEKEARLKMLKSGARTEEIELARTTVTKSEERLRYAEGFLDMEKSLYEDKLSSKKDYETAAELATLRARELDESKGNLKLLLAGTRPEEIESMQAEIHRLTAQRQYLVEQLKSLRIVSPISGIIATHRLKEKVGSNLKKGDLLAEVHQLQVVTAEIAVSEKEISDVAVGLPVSLKARAFIDRRFTGKVVAISPVASKATEGVPERNFLVVTELPNPDFTLRPEMTGNAKIACGERRLYEIVFRRLIRFVRVEFWSWW